MPEMTLRQAFGVKPEKKNRFYQSKLGKAETIAPPADALEWARSKYQRYTPEWLQSLFSNAHTLGQMSGLEDPGTAYAGGIAPASLKTGMVFHGGPKRILKIDPGKLQSRDAGFYGKGFYVTDEAHMARNYGGKVTEFLVDPQAKIVNASLKPEESPELLQDVISWLKETFMPKVIERGKESQFLDELDGIKSDPLAWKNAVDRYAEATGADIVKYAPGEIVVKNPAVLRAKGR
jgi:hypothetical protein